MTSRDGKLRLNGAYAEIKHHVLAEEGGDGDALATARHDGDLDVLDLATTCRVQHLEVDVLCVVALELYPDLVLCNVTVAIVVDVTKVQLMSY